MHNVFVRFDYPTDNDDCRIFETLDTKDLKISIVQRNNKQSTKNNIHYINDEFEHKLKWWQNSDILFKYVAELNADIVYIFGLDLPLHFRWIKHFISPKIVLIAQHCGETPWIQKNLWLQQSSLRVVDGFVFNKKSESNIWTKCAAILDSQPVFELDNFKDKMIDIYKGLQDERANN